MEPAVTRLSQLAKLGPEGDINVPLRLGKTDRGEAGTEWLGGWTWRGMGGWWRKGRRGAREGGDEQQQQQQRGAKFPV